MNILFKCFKCKDKKEVRKEVHSFNWNKESKPFKIKELCEHFSNIEFNWKTKYGFFTLGWKVEIYNVCIKCNNCKKLLIFANQIFNASSNSYEETKDCCDNIIVYSAHEGKFDCSDEGITLQDNINKQIEEIKEAEEKNKKLKEAQEQLEKEEKLWKQKDEEERKEREEEEKKQKEKEQRRRSQYKQENKEMFEIEKQQEKENNELNKKINIGASWIEEQMSQMISEANANISRNINYNARKTIKANTQFQVGK